MHRELCFNICIYFYKILFNYDDTFNMRMICDVMCVSFFALRHIMSFASSKIDCMSFNTRTMVWVVGLHLVSRVGSSSPRWDVELALLWFLTAWSTVWLYHNFVFTSYYVINSILLNPTKYRLSYRLFGLVKLEGCDPFDMNFKNMTFSSKVALALFIRPFLSLIFIVWFYDFLYTYDGWERDAYWGA